MERTTQMRKILFIFDRVVHYHQDLFQRLETDLPAFGCELHVLSGEANAGSTGRVGLAKPSVVNETKYRFHEYSVGTYVLRTATGIVPAVRALRPDIVVCMAHVGNITHWWLALDKQRLGYRLFAWQCGYEYNRGRLKNWLLQRFVPRFDHHLAYHSNARDYALMHGARPQQVTVIHNTINEARIQRIPKPAARALLLEHHPDLGDRKIVLFVGAVLREKRIDVILEAIRLMARTDLVLMVVGDGPHLSDLRAAAQGRRDVIFAGSVIEGVGPYFDAAEVYVLPGTGGLGINEAMAHGLPIISGYADGSADDLVRDGENGFRLHAGGAVELTAKLAAVLDDPERAARMGAVSRDWITGRFSFEAFIQRVESALGCHQPVRSLHSRATLQHEASRRAEP
jgi:glycosyltransferase involved in cell wall biosynthesis